MVIFAGPLLGAAPPPPPVIPPPPNMPPRPVRANMPGPLATAGERLAMNMRYSHLTRKYSSTSWISSPRKPKPPIPPPKNPWPSSSPPMPAPISPPSSPEVKAEPRDCWTPEAKPPLLAWPDCGVFGVMLRCIGSAPVGAVRVVGGAEYVRLPRRPDELPPPARASARPGARTSAKAAEPAIRAEVRRIWFRSDFDVVTCTIWWVRYVLARGNGQRRWPGG